MNNENQGILNPTDNKTSFKDKILRFFSNDANFRFAFTGALIFASLNVVRFWFYVLVGILMIWGAGLFIYRMLYKGFILRVRSRRLILLFLGCALVTILLHITSNFFVNFYYVAFMGMCFFHFYGIHAGRSRSRCISEVCTLLDFINIVTTIMMIIGLVLLFMYPKGFSFGGDAFSIFESRFVGILFNANVTAFYALMAFIACNLLWTMKKRRQKLSGRLKALYIVCGIINLLSLYLTDSNASLLLLIIYVCFIAFYAIFRGYKRGVLSILFRLIALMLSVVIICAVLVISRTLVQQGVTSVLKKYSPTTSISTGVTAKPNGNVIVKPDNRPKNSSFGHQNTNIDSGRFTIWRQSMMLFREFPVMGIGKANVVDYGKKYINGGLKYEDFHNGLITIAVCYGAVGIIIFMVLAITMAKRMLKDIFRYREENRRDGRVLMYLTAFCTAYVVYSTVEVALLVDIAYRVVIFWLMMGLATAYADSYERSALRKGQNVSERSRSLRRIAAYNYRSYKTNEIY